MGGLSRNTLPEWHRWQNGENIPYLQAPFLQRLQPGLRRGTARAEYARQVQQHHQTYMSPSQFTHLPRRSQMLHHRLGFHEGRRYWLRGLPHIHAGHVKCQLPCKSKHLHPRAPLPHVLPLTDHTLLGIPPCAKPCATMISSSNHTLYPSIWLHLCPPAAFPRFLHANHHTPHPSNSCFSCIPAE